MTKLEMISLLDKKISSCNKCSELTNRTNYVYGEGNLKADVLFLGEAPGKDEDIQGRPFVGQAGKLLNSIIESCGWSRDDVYICNTLHCRPPNNRMPTCEETSNCFPYLSLRLDVVSPKVIVSLGACATRILLGTNERISALRGSWHHYKGIAVMPTFHPSYLLRKQFEKTI